MDSKIWACTQGRKPYKSKEQPQDGSGQAPTRNQSAIVLSEGRFEISDTELLLDKN